MQIESTPVRELRPHPNNARTHSQKQIRQIAKSIKQFGFCNPVLVDDAKQIIAGHGRVQAAELLGIEAVPTCQLSHLSDADKRAYVLADNKLAEKAGWDRELLAIELQGLIELDVDIELTGFEMAEIDLILEEAREASGEPNGPEDQAPEPSPGPAVSQTGDLWLLGSHRLLCGDARDKAAYDQLLAGAKAEFVFTDPPYNVAIDGHVCGLGRVRHRDFAMACGEMSEAEFTAFLEAVFRSAGREQRRRLDPSGLHGLAPRLGDAGRRPRGLQRAQEPLRLEQEQRRHGLILPLQARARVRVEVRDRSAHQQFRTRAARPPSHQRLGLRRRQHHAGGTAARAGDAPNRQTGRLGGRRDQGLLAPCWLGARPLLRQRHHLDRSRADRPQARALEIDPNYVDVAVRRWQACAGKSAVLAGSGETFETTESCRITKPAAA